MLLTSKLNKAAYITLAALAINGCGSSDEGGDDGGQRGNNNSPRTGVFLDSPVANIRYITASQSGFTDSEGQYQFIPGETITFSIGGMELPTLLASGLITPLNIFNTTDVNDPRVTNLLRLLQTLDTDGNPNNGISISDTAHSTAAELSIDFSSSSFDTDVETLISNSGSVTTTLLDSSTAVDHFNSTLASISLTTERLSNVALKPIQESDVFPEGLTFDANGSGLMKFPQASYNDFSDLDFATFTWSVGEDGVLTLIDEADFTWTIEATEITDSNIKIAWSVSGIEDGVSVSDAGLNDTVSYSVDLTGNWEVYRSYSVCGEEEIRDNVDFMKAVSVAFNSETGLFSFTQNFTDEIFNPYFTLVPEGYEDAGEPYVSCSGTFSYNSAESMLESSAIAVEDANVTGHELMTVLDNIGFVSNMGFIIINGPDSFVVYEEIDTGIEAHGTVYVGQQWVRQTQ